MHPLHVDLTARLITEERLAQAATQRRIRLMRPSRPTVRARVGTGLVRMGTRLQSARVSSPTAVAGC